MFICSQIVSLAVFLVGYDTLYFNQHHLSYSFFLYPPSFPPPSPPQSSVLLVLQVIKFKGFKSAVYGISKTTSKGKNWIKNIWRKLTKKILPRKNVLQKNFIRFFRSLVMVAVISYRDVCKPPTKFFNSIFVTGGIGLHGFLIPPG